MSRSAVDTGINLSKIQVGAVALEDVHLAQVCEVRLRAACQLRIDLNRDDSSRRPDDVRSSDRRPAIVRSPSA